MGLTSRVVDPNSAADHLLDLSAFGTPDHQKEPALRAAVVEELRFHYEHSPIYRRFCDQRGFNPEDVISRLDQIPALPVQAFKELGFKLGAVTDGEIHVRLESSATTGTPSTVLLDRLTARRQARALGKVMSAVLGGQRRHFWVFDAPPGANVGSLGARTAATRGFLSVASSAEYLLDASPDGSLSLPFERIEQAAARANAAGLPVCVFGFTYLLYADVVKPLQDLNRSVRLPLGSKVIHIGGWKKLTNLGLSVERFSQSLAAIFGINPNDVVDLYGFTEQIGLVYPTCAAGFKHVPAYSEIVIRNALTMEPVPDGTDGVMEFVTPIPHSYPGVAVVTDDRGRVLGRGLCECGWHGTRFEVLGRLEGAEPRGCGDVIADRGATPRSRPASGRGRQIRLIYDGGERHESSVPVESLERIATDLRTAQRHLSSLPVDDIISLIGNAAERWESRDHPLAHLRQHGLSFMASWCKPDRLRRMADASFGGSRAVLDGFRPDPVVPRREIKAVPRGIVAHWLAGNAPTLGMLSVLGSLLSKNASLVKVPSGLPAVLPILLDDLAHVTAVSRGGREIMGGDLAKAISVVEFGREHHEAAARLSELADVRVAWGGADAVRAIMELPRRYGTEDVIFGPKLSLMVIGRDALLDPASVSKLARQAALDCSSFEQYACSSPHTIFVEHGGAAASPRDFAIHLSEAMSATLKRLPKADINGSMVGRIQSARMKHIASGEVFGPQGLEWSVLYDERLELAEPVYYRTVFVRAVADVMEIPRLLSSTNQTVGLALPGARRHAFLDAAAAAGVERFPTVGHMTDYDAPWDGHWPLARMVRFVSAGAPA